MSPVLLNKEGFKFFFYANEHEPKHVHVVKGGGMSTLKIKDVHFTDSYLNIKLNDGRIISTPLDWYRELQDATVKQLKDYKLICRGTGIEWEDLDYHLSVESMLSVEYIPHHKNTA